MRQLLGELSSLTDGDSMPLLRLQPTEVFR